MLPAPMRRVPLAATGLEVTRMVFGGAPIGGLFGPDRLMFGSDWPVCTLAASYGEVLDLALALLAGRLGPAEMDAVLAGNAAGIYGLCVPGDLQD